jgi:hyaluronoglucosaminidase
MHPPLGLIEGFYGKPWTWSSRALTSVFLKAHGDYRFYLYAPKADAFLRRRWKELHPPETAAELKALSQHCRAHGVRFGVGLSPYEIYRDFDDTAKFALAAKLAHLDEIGIDDLGILFDDMRGDLPDLARAQVEIVHWIREHSGATRFIVCPTYYTDDPVLDRFFGARPVNYLEDFGRALAPGIEIFWTGEEVCSKFFTPDHLARVEAQLGRKPFLWDNYPVNDGPRMSPFLHLRAFMGRPSSIGAHIAAHGINASSQPMLSWLPALTLVESYKRDDAYDPDAAFAWCGAVALGSELAQMLRDDLELLQDKGREAVQHLRARYAAIDHPAAREIVAWLDGFWSITRAEIESQ